VNERAALWIVIIRIGRSSDAEVRAWPDFVGGRRPSVNESCGSAIERNAHFVYAAVHFALIEKI